MVYRALLNKAYNIEHTTTYYTFSLRTHYARTKPYWA